MFVAVGVSPANDRCGLDRNTQHDIVWKVLGAGMRCCTMSNPARTPPAIEVAVIEAVALRRSYRRRHPRRSRRPSGKIGD
jgi:hypothetical protein